MLNVKGRRQVRILWLPDRMRTGEEEVGKEGDRRKWRTAMIAIPWAVKMDEDGGKLIWRECCMEGMQKAAPTFGGERNLEPSVNMY